MVSVTGKGTSNFKWSELTNSYVANKRGIDNTIPEELYGNANELLSFLQGVRDSYGKPITISSGYRCKALNEAVGGSKNSSHLECSAADLVTKDMDGFVEFMKEYLDDKMFDQCIIERSSRSYWVHLGIRHSYYGQRRQLFSKIL